MSPRETAWLTESIPQREQKLQLSQKTFDRIPAHPPSSTHPGKASCETEGVTWNKETERTGRCPLPLVAEAA